MERECGFADERDIGTLECLGGGDDAWRLPLGLGLIDFVVSLCAGPVECAQVLLFPGLYITHTPALCYAFRSPRAWLVGPTVS